MIQRTKEDVERDVKKRKLVTGIYDAITGEENWNMIIEVLSDILHTEIKRFNKEYERK